MAETDNIEVPPYFLCPITLETMKDPVTVATGITYDRESIERWIFSQKNTTCPVTKQDLKSLDLTPNITLRRLIQAWCTLHAVERLPTPKPPATVPQISKLLEDTQSPTRRRKSLQTLKSIAAQSQTNKRSLESAGAAAVLSAIVVNQTLSNPQLFDDGDGDAGAAAGDALSILYSLQLSESGLKTLANPQFIESLTLIMQSGSYESRTYSIMLLNPILEESSNPNLLINLTPEFFTQISQTLKDQISPKATKSSLKALITSISWGRNRIKAVESGAVPALIDLLLESSDKRTSEMALTALDSLCQCADGRSGLLTHSAGLAVVSKKILRISSAASERAVRILQSVSRHSSTPAVLQEMLQIGVVAKLCLIVQVDCGSKIRERAREILRTHSRAWRNSPCVPVNLMLSYPCS
ncbi:E3 ubiquitin-protein ligase PUB23-like [Andrographis paniculata]|uniref:E3 ubiquitin-protein ligase PUB23-like n=1 Tax=Andrographis paniculata TaxID=175694 RepID=UPI0021E800A8|nr:E3 ubiquitin-protein ligase PUB23-like [Andrographis paniculata]